MQELLRKLPKIDRFITNKAFDGLSPTLLTQIAQESIDQIRQEILDKKIESIDETDIVSRVLKVYDEAIAPSLRPLINATGVILHTNMGRSLIDQEILDRASKVICNYSNLEYDQKAGKRGERYSHLSRSLGRLLGVEDVLVVNNNASAVFLILNTFAKGKEAVVSRGELVEIGGSFRIPEVMANSGALLHEVGATNKTRIADYENAINENTAILMKVHRSNFTIEGFSAEVAYGDIKALAKEHNLIDYYDLGSGYIPELPYNLSSQELPISKVLENNPDLISFSGDKLFGSVQAGIIAGRKELIDELKKNQLLRMLRVDKVILSLLEESIRAYLEHRYDLIPTLRLLHTDMANLRNRAKKIAEAIGADKCEVIESTTFMGGGTLPGREFPTIALKIFGKATALEREFRSRDVIGRIEDGSFLIDFRALEKRHESSVVKAAREVLS
jgi:L-seryl-tRNA(Ser) seleniumtransferase